MSRSPNSRSGGFSLLEVLAAFVILTLVVLGLFRLYSGALNNASVAEEYSRALLIAESRLASLGVERPLRESSERGTEADERFAWETTVAPYVPPRQEGSAIESEQPHALALWQLAVRVSWAGSAGRGRSVELTTLRTAARE